MCDIHFRLHVIKYFTAHNLLPLEATSQSLLKPSSKEPICSSHFTVTQPLRLPTEKCILHPSALLLLQPGALPGTLGLTRNEWHPQLSVKTAQPFISSPPGRWWVDHSTLTAQPHLGTCHLNVPTPDCLTQHNGALNWRVAWSWVEAAETRTTMVERQRHRWQQTFSTTPTTL